MNAAIRSVVRTGIARGWKVFGIPRGFAGLLEDRPIRLTSRDVSGIIQRGGTILGSARCPEFKTSPGQLRAYRRLRRSGLDALVVIGGNGSQAGANALSILGFPVVGIASTIDNDLCGSDITIGVDTALNIALEAIDRLKTTASSHGRVFVVEVMGRDCGYLALAAGVAGGAEVVMVPEIETDPEDVAAAIRSAYLHGKHHALVVVAEGATYGAERLVAYFEKHRERLGFDLRSTILGHVQRGGAPGAFDRLLASRLGAAATLAIAQNRFGVLAGLVRDEIVLTPLAAVVSEKKPIDPFLLDLAKVLAE